MEKFMLVKFADRSEEALIDLQKVEAIYRTVLQDGVVELEIHYSSGKTSTYYNKEAEAIWNAWRLVLRENNIIAISC